MLSVSSVRTLQAKTLCGDRVMLRANLQRVGSDRFWLNATSPQGFGFLGSVAIQKGLTVIDRLPAYYFNVDWSPRTELILDNPIQLADLA